jgi:hypothetical protein
MSPTVLARQLTLRSHTGRDLAAACRRLTPFVREQGSIPLGHTPYLLQVADGGRTRGDSALTPLAPSTISPRPIAPSLA